MKTFLAHQNRVVHLGKHPPRIDPRTPHVRAFLSREHLTAPSKQDWIAASKIANWPMLLNDQIGDCVIAGKGHEVQAASCLINKHIVAMMTDQQAIADYGAVGGYNPADPSTDQGCDMLTAEQYGVATGYMGGTQKTLAYAAVQPKDTVEVQACINLFGGVATGLAMPISAQAQVGGVWDVPSGGAKGNGAPGSWGGHYVPTMAYGLENGLLACVTWGAVQRMTLRFLQTYCDEMYAHIWAEWVNAPHQQAPNKYRLSQLAADLKAASSQAIAESRFAWRLLEPASTVGTN